MIEKRCESTLYLKKSLKRMKICITNNVNGRMKRIEKSVLCADVALCSLGMLVFVHNQPFYPIVYFLCLLRVWLSFLLYRRSTMALYPIVLLGVFGLFVPLGFRSMDLTPFVQASEALLSFFGGDGRGTVSGWTGQASADGCRMTVKAVVAFVGYAWLVVLPLAHYLCLHVKKRTVKTQWSTRKCMLLCAYLVGSFIAVVMCYGRLGLGTQYAAHLCMVLLILALVPIIFNRGKLRGLLARYEIAFLLVMAVFVASYLSGVSITSRSAVAVVMLPMVCYMIGNWYYRRKVAYRDMALVLFGMVVFWMAQYLTGVWRIICLLLSAILMLVPVMRMVRFSGKRGEGAVLFVLMAWLVPVMSIGYNPYTVLDAGRWHDADEYNGMLYVRSEKGVGLRDRYGIVLPAEYRRIDNVELKDYTLKVWGVDEQGEWEQKLYDIRRKEFVCPASDKKM